jgi:hypothetical protein
MNTLHLMNDDEDDGDRPKPRKGKTVAGGKKGPVPPALAKAMRARQQQRKTT